jgi:class 3 adenylate cyclase
MFGILLASPLGALWEPSQVFTLLETVYHAFDEIAKRRRVFKVETIGDCYVAVTGLLIRERIMPSSWHASPVML